MTSRFHTFRKGCFADSSSLGNSEQSKVERYVEVRTPRVMRMPFRSTICVTRPPVCADQLLVISKS